MNRTRVVAVIALIFTGVFVAYALGNAQATSSPETVHLQATGVAVTVHLEAENNSGQSGTAILTDLGNGQTKIEIDVAGEPAGASQPMHVHEGQCGPTLATLIFKLNNLENGKA